MITLTATIELISNNGGDLSSVDTNLSGNNISGDISKILGVKTKPSNPFIIGASRIGDGSKFSSGVDYFISKSRSNSKGEFETACEITINSSKNISNLTISFDTENGRHPNSIKIDGVDYIDDDSIFTITNLSDSSKHTIIIDNWNTPNYPLVITGIYVALSVNINKRNLISFERSISYRADNKLPSYGIISNTGKIDFKDIDGEIRDYAEQMILTSDLEVSVSLYNTLNQKSEQIGAFETREWDYDSDNRNVSVSLKDNLEEWQDIWVDGFDYDPRNPYAVLDNGTMADLYKWLWKNVTPSKYQMLSFDRLDENTRTILNNTRIKYPLLKNGTLWSQWQKLCKVCGLYIYKNNNGETVCIYTLGS